MSHFTVMIVGDDIESQLAPFQENNMGDCPQEFLEFLEDADADVDDLTGTRGYWRNPNSKWDWWQVGGRWSNFLLLKSGEHANSALKCEIDWKGMMDADGERAARRYDFALSKIGHTPKHEAWHFDEGGGPVEEQREKYWSQPRLVAWKQIDREELYKNGFGLFSSPDELLIDRDNYIRLAQRKAVCTHAFLKSGKWAERGEMGWFAHVSNENDAWEDIQWKLIEALPDDARLTIVDCHI